jgi:hypothetical protein
MGEAKKLARPLLSPCSACRRDGPSRYEQGEKTMSFKKIALTCLVLVGVGIYASNHMTAERKVAYIDPTCGNLCEPW